MSGERSRSVEDKEAREGVVRRGLARGRTSRRPVDAGISELKTRDHTALPERQSGRTVPTLPGRYDQTPDVAWKANRRRRKAEGRQAGPGHGARGTAAGHSSGSGFGLVPQTGSWGGWPPGGRSCHRRPGSQPKGQGSGGLMRHRAQAITTGLPSPPARPTAAKAEQVAGLPPCVAVTRPPNLPGVAPDTPEGGAGPFVPRGRRRVLPGFRSIRAGDARGPDVRAHVTVTRLPHPARLAPQGADRVRTFSTTSHREAASPCGTTWGAGPPAPPGGREQRQREC